MLIYKLINPYNMYDADINWLTPTTCTMLIYKLINPYNMYDSDI